MARMVGGGRSHLNLVFTECHLSGDKHLISRFMARSGTNGDTCFLATLFPSECRVANGTTRSASARSIGGTERWPA